MLKACLAFHVRVLASLCVTSGVETMLPRYVIIIIINLIDIAQFDTNGILTVLYIVITYIQMQYVHV